MSDHMVSTKPQGLAAQHGAWKQTQTDTLLVKGFTTKWCPQIIYTFVIISAKRVIYA